MSRIDSRQPVRQGELLCLFCCPSGNFFFLGGPVSPRSNDPCTFCQTDAIRIRPPAGKSVGNHHSAESVRGACIGWACAAYEMEGFWLSASTLSVAEQSTLANFQVPAVAVAAKPANQPKKQSANQPVGSHSRQEYRGKLHDYGGKPAIGQRWRAEWGKRRQRGGGSRGEREEQGQE